jgi:hypothetical protein
MRRGEQRKVILSWLGEDFRIRVERRVRHAGILDQSA